VAVEKNANMSNAEVGFMIHKSVVTGVAHLGGEDFVNFIQSLRLPDG